MAIMFVFFYLSNYYSTIEWCSNDHIYSHFWAHMFALAGIYFTFFVEETKQMEEVDAPPPAIISLQTLS